MQHISAWVGHNSPHLSTGLCFWIRTRGLIVEKEKRLIEAVCACGHKQRRQEFRGRMWILREMICCLFFPAIMKAKHVLCSVSPVHYPHLFVLKARHQCWTARGQAKQHCSVQRKSERKYRTSLASGHSCLCLARKMLQTNRAELWYPACVLQCGCVTGRGGRRVMPIFAPSTAAQQKPREVCAVARFRICWRLLFSRKKGVSVHSGHKLVWYSTPLYS